MAPKLNQVLSTLILLSIILDLPPTAMSQECPYPCYPPPTGTVNNPPTTPSATFTPPPPSQIGSYPPPAFFPPPSGYLPYSPPYLGNAPPPPEPILPWFPYYYRKPPHQTSDQSASTAPQGATAVIATTHFLGLLFLFFF